jgi:hypothetical protein
MFRYKRSIGVRIAPLIGSNLGCPPRSTGFRECPVFWTAMPEAPIDEYGDPRVGENKIRSAATKRGQRSCIDAVPKPAPPELATKRQLGCGIPASLVLHPLSDDRR